MGSRTVLVTGSTGATGSALVPRLVARGLGVRAMVRDAARDVTTFARDHAALTV